MPIEQQGWFEWSSALPSPAAETGPADPAPMPGGETLRTETLDATDGGAARTDVVLRCSRRATRYRLSVGRTGQAVLTMPLGGSESRARRFLESHRDWLARTRERLSLLPRQPEVWTVGTRLLWRGEWRAIERTTDLTPQVALGSDRFRVRNHESDLRATLESQFQRVARIELPPRTWELAAVTGVEVAAVNVRNQRTRWGSCSRRGTISLNWRLVQAPPFVADYIVLHELMHRREMNHSVRFWRLVAVVCPQWREAEKWLKNHGSALGL